MVSWLESLQNAKTKVSRAHKKLVLMDVLDDVDSTCYKGGTTESAESFQRFFPEFREGYLGFIGKFFMKLGIMY